MSSVKETAVIALFAVMAAYLGMGIRYAWNEIQPVREIRSGVVESVKPYYTGGISEGVGYKVRIQGEEKIIKFYKGWKITIKPGSSIDAVVREPYFSGELDGLSAAPSY